MKKIRSIKQLKAEKKRIELHQRQLEQKIVCCWTELKENLRPANLAKETVYTVVRKKLRENAGNGSLVKNIISYTALALVNRMMAKPVK